MKRNLLFGALALVATTLMAADSKDEVIAAAKKLADKSNYTWKVTTDLGPNAQFGPLISDGKTEKDGFTSLSSTFGDNVSEGFMKGTNKVAVKTDEGWKTAEEATAGGGGGGGGFNPGAFMARRMQTLKVPAAEAEELASKTKELKKEGDVLSGELTEEAAKALVALGFGGRRGGQQPQVSNAKASVKFWMKDGVLTKFESKATGKRTNQNGDEVDVDRTTTIEIKDVGTTKLTVPEDAKKKLS